jgi:alanine-synthesizing transaminase
MMILGFPSNPTARCVELDFFERVVALAKEHDILVVHDLAYADIVFDVLSGAIDHAGAGRARRGGRVLHHVEELQHGRLAGRLHGRQQGAVQRALARIKSYHDYGTFTPIQVASVIALDGSQDCVEEVRLTYQNGAATCWPRGCTKPAGWSRCRKRRCTSGPRFPAYRHLGSLEFAKKLLALMPRWRLSPGVGFGEYGDDHVRFALIENEERTRQAVRGIKDMFRKGRSAACSSRECTP